MFFPGTEQAPENPKAGPPGTLRSVQGDRAPRRRFGQTGEAGTAESPRPVSGAHPPLWASGRRSLSEASGRGSSPAGRLVPRGLGPTHAFGPLPRAVASLRPETYFSRLFYLRPSEAPEFTHLRRPGLAPGAMLAWRLGPGRLWVAGILVQDELLRMWRHFGFYLFINF